MRLTEAAQDYYYAILDRSPQTQRDQAGDIRSLTHYQHGDLISRPYCV